MTGWLRSATLRTLSSLGSCSETKALIAQRFPAWKTVERLSLLCGWRCCRSGCCRQTSEAIRTQRLLTDSTDPVPALRSELTHLLRQALNEAFFGP